MKKLLLLALAVFFCFSCSDDKNDGTPSNGNGTGLTSLAGTEWRCSEEVTEEGLTFTMQYTLSFTSSNFTLLLEAIFMGMTLDSDSASGTYTYNNPNFTIRSSEMGEGSGKVISEKVLQMNLVNGGTLRMDRL